MNSRRGEPRTPFFTFYLIWSIEKKAVNQEHYSSKGVHFQFHVSKVHLYICCVLFICYFILTSIVKKWLIFYGLNGGYNDNCNKKEKKKNRKNLPLDKIWTWGLCFASKLVTAKAATKTFSKLHVKQFLFKQNWCHDHHKHLQHAKYVQRNL